MGRARDRASADLNGQEFILDADADTSISADTDDQIDIKIAGADDFQFTANTFTAQSGSTIAAQALTATTITASDAVTIQTADNDTQLTLISTDADANVAPTLDLTRDSSSPADDDFIGRIRFRGENDASEVINYAAINAVIKDVTDGTEDGRLDIRTFVAGTERSRILINETETVFNEDSVDVDFRIESNAKSHALFVDADNDSVLVAGSDVSVAVTNEADDFIIGSTSKSIGGMTIANSSTGYGSINFSDATSGNGRIAAYIAYDHNNDEWVFGGQGQGNTLFKIHDNGRWEQFGCNTTSQALHIKNDGNNTNRKGMIVQCGTDDNSGTNTAISFDDGDGSGQGSITFSGGTVTYGAFTAHHEISLPNADKTNGYDYGTLVDIDQIYYAKNRNGTEQSRGIRYLVKKSSSAYSKKILGAYCGDMSEQADKDIYYTEDDKIKNKIPSDKKVGDLLREAGTYKGNLHQAAVLGDGHIICNGEKGNISVGDGITTSSTAGVGMKADKLCMIVGIAQEDITFSSASETKLVSVQYGIRQFTPWTD